MLKQSVSVGIANRIFWSAFYRVRKKLKAERFARGQRSRAQGVLTEYFRSEQSEESLPKEPQRSLAIAPRHYMAASSV
jgi:hypothetical protein